MDMSTQDHFTNIEFDKVKYTNKPYGAKLPPKVNVPMMSFTNGCCYAVKKLEQSLGLNQAEGNCHHNVLEHVAEFGGEAVNGWLLAKDKTINKHGAWMWSFHSIWKTKEGLLVDVTFDTRYENADRTIFFEDKKRCVDWKEGISYNNIMLFDNLKFAEHYGQSIGEKLTTKQIYWADSQFKVVKKLNEHSGQYSWLSDEYPDNQEMFSDVYGPYLDCEGMSDSAKANALAVHVMFNFSMSSISD